MIPAVVVSNTCSYCPAKRETSVEVPNNTERKCQWSHFGMKFNEIDTFQGFRKVNRKEEL